jgi:Protein of unknown function (DUF3800)
VTIQAYIDDSGAKGQGRAFVLAGWIGEAEQCAGLANDWKQCLSSFPEIDYFKMREAASLRGQFAGLSEKLRDQKLRDLVRIIRQHGLTAYWCVTDLDAFAQTFARAYQKPCSDFYFWPFQMTMLGIGIDVSARGCREAAEITFDEQVIFGPRASEWYPRVRAAMSDGSVAAVLPAEPAFCDDKAVVPLQAADLLAWMLHRVLHNSLNPFAWLAREELDLPQSPYCQVIDEPRMRSILQQSYRTLFERLLAREGVASAINLWPARSKSTANEN